MKVRQAFGETRFVPWLGREVADGEIIDVDPADVAGYLEGGWLPSDKEARDTHQHLLAEKNEGRPGVTVGTLKKPPAKPAESTEAEGGQPPAADETTVGEGEA